MALKRILDSLDNLDDAHKGLYTEREGKFYLDVEPEGDVDALKRAKDREALAAKEAREALAAEKAAREDLETKLAEATGGKRKPDEIQRAYETKLADAQKKYEKIIADKNAYIKQSLIDAAAAKLADVFVIPSVGTKLVKDRLSVEFEDDKPVLRVLDAAGDISALSLDDLKREYVDNRELAPLIKASNASGGGASGAGKGGGSAAPKPYEMTQQQRVEWLQRDRAGFMAAQARGDFNKPASVKQ